jgi:hypothetical protein
MDKMKAEGQGTEAPKTGTPLPGAAPVPQPTQPAPGAGMPPQPQAPAGAPTIPV